MEIYHDIFDGWEKVQQEYSMEEPEPEEVLLAHYRYEDYSGSSIVIYRNADKYYYVQGGHCSCYGLEGQWEPTEYESKDLFVKCLEQMDLYDSEANKAIEAVIEKLK